MWGRLDGKQAGEQRNEDHADYGHTSARHELLHSLAFSPGIVVTITFQKVDDTPNAETGTECDYEGLKNGDCLSKKCHK